MSLRVASGFCILAFLGLVAGLALGQEEIDWDAVRAEEAKGDQMGQEVIRRGREEAYQRMLQRNPEMRVFYEQLGSGATFEERTRAMQDWQRRQNMENFKKQLGVSEEEWTIVQPRLETVYLLCRPPAFFAQEDESASAVASRLTRELSELLNNKEAKPEDIKAKLTALRSAKEKVRQELAKARGGLRKIVTVRQEAVLVLSDLLD